MRLISTIIFVSVITVSSSVYAETASYNDAIEEFLSIMCIDQKISNMKSPLLKLVIEFMQQMDVPDDKKQVYDRYYRRITQIIRKEMQWNRLKRDVIALYASVFTEDEINEMIRFYKSPVGSKFVSKMPYLMRESIIITKDKTQHTWPKVQEMLEEMEDELKK